MHHFRPRNYRELFNLCHATARNVIEQIFGVVKRQFRLQVVAPEHTLGTQAQMVPALCVLHNFICVHDVDDLPTLRDNFQSCVTQCTVHADSLEGLGGDISTAEKRRATEARDTIAKEMWDSYQRYLNDHGGNN